MEVLFSLEIVQPNYVGGFSFSAGKIRSEGNEILRNISETVEIICNKNVFCKKCRLYSIFVLRQDWKDLNLQRV